MRKSQIKQDRPVAHGPILKGKAAAEFLAWQQEYIQRCLPNPKNPATIEKKQEVNNENGK